MEFPFSIKILSLSLSLSLSLVPPPAAAAEAEAAAGPPAGPPAGAQGGRADHLRGAGLLPAAPQLLPGGLAGPGYEGRFIRSFSLKWG